MRVKFPAALGTLQVFFLMARWIASLAGFEVSWFITLIPLWILLFVAVIFWGLVGAIWSRF